MRRASTASRRAARRKASEYAKQLREKQKVKRIYGLTERQFRNTFDTVAQEGGVKGTNLLVALETRLDNIVYRMGFASSRKAARQLVRHGHVEVNGRRVDIPSYHVRAGPGSPGGPGQPRARRRSRRRRKPPPAAPPLSWLTVDRDKAAGRITERPTRDADPDQRPGTAHRRALLEVTMTIDLTGLVRPHLVEMTKREDNPNYAEFRLQPLERGFGYTLGNSLRRLLLSSLRGTAVWAFRLDGVVHEHQTVQGVLEDVHQIIQRLKALTLVLAEDVDEAVLTIKRDGRARSTPATSSRNGLGPDRQSRPPALHGAGRPRRHGELYVNKGRGYVEAELQPTDRSLPVDLVRIDAIYNPVRRANFTRGRDPRRPAHRLRPAHGHGRDQRHHHARGRDRLRRGAGPGALPLLRRVRQGPGRPPGVVAGARRRPASPRAPAAPHRRPRPLGPVAQLAQEFQHPDPAATWSNYTEEELLKVKNVGEKALAGNRRAAAGREGLNFGMQFEEVDGELRVVECRDAAARSRPPRARTPECATAPRAASSPAPAPTGARC